MKRLSAIILTAFYFIISHTALFPQEITKSEFTRTIRDADISFYYDNDYVKAAPLYEVVLKAYPDNCNIAAKLGVCYLNIEGKEKDALRLLSAASKNVASDKKEYTEDGEKAPPYTLMYLATAYHVNDSLDKALSLYYDLRENVGEDDISVQEYIDNQIRDCSYARELKKRPLTILSELFVPWLKEYPGACNPAISKNDSVFVFTWKNEGKTRILCSYKNKTWRTPVDITRQLGGNDRFYSNSITGDGKLLVLFMDDGGDGNLYFSRRTDTTWTRIKGLGKNINSIYWESHGFITPDGKKLYFSSNRPHGEGELDIWSSTRDDDGSWDKPVNLGKIINTPYNEDTPFFDPESNALIFSSEGHISMGGYDVFRSVMNYNSWTNPVGMPFAFNTTSDNTFFVLNNNAPGFVTNLYNKSDTSRNIYAIVARDPADEITLLEGFILLGDGLKPAPEKVTVNLTNIKNVKTPVSLQVNTEDKFRADIKPGDYIIHVSYPGYKTDTIKVNLPLYFLSRYVRVQSNLIPEEVTEGKLLTFKNILFAYNSFKLDSLSLKTLEEIKSVLVSNPGIKIEIAGYTDAKGSSEYNLILARKRVNAVTDYLTSGGIPVSRFVRKAFGESNFVAVNTNNDGSDNPEGRKYNRRVAFGIVDSQTGVTLRKDIYTPEHLRLASSMKYSIVLTKSVKKLPEEHFSTLSFGGRLFLSTVESDSMSLYVLGVFYNRPDAVKYLAYASEKGFNEAYVINQYELNGEAKSQYNRIQVISNTKGKKTYTIQIKAARSPVNMNTLKEIHGIKELLGEDGFYRYITGEYSTLAGAKDALKTIRASGYKDAFIRELNLLINK
jgi:outer membrane protein OmpA-like peptidoglycan-associated protein